MPAVNHVVLASGAVVAVSMALATAMALYESPELRRYADDIRRRIAIALHSMGDGINPAAREPLFNRPEDADGFLQSRRGDGAEPGVDADDETRRRQRDELLYWNSVRMENQEKAMRAQAEAMASNTPRAIRSARGSSFDDFLRPDASAENGTFVFNTGADAGHDNDGLRHRGEGARGFNSALYANPFADEHHIGNDEVEDVGASQMTPAKDEIMSDIYSATTRDQDERQTATLEASPDLIDVGETPSEVKSSVTLERELADGEYMSASQEDNQEAYASIQAWANDSSRNFYSPLPVTPSQPVSEPELISDGEATPTDSISLVGSGEDIADEAQSSRAGETGRPFDVMSESDGMLTPASWSEVGSVVSENESPLRA